jgi:hypothetical protein
MAIHPALKAANLRLLAPFAMLPDCIQKHNA